MIDKHNRQSFLGANSENVLRNVCLGIVGLGGGGSHIAQQSAHIGVGKVHLFDKDKVDREGTNLNRLIGATEQDVFDQTPKVEVAERLITRIDPTIDVVPHLGTWQANHLFLRECDVVIGGLDGLINRRDLENATRRFLIPYVDIGMTVQNYGNRFVISGQVALSMPGKPCMRCLGLLPDHLIAKEAGEYGNAGWNPQVVWPNGVLASTAIGIFMQLVTPWFDQSSIPILFEYDGNGHTVRRSMKLDYLGYINCTHYPHSEIGDPFLR